MQWTVRRYIKNVFIELLKLPDFDDDHKIGPIGEVQSIFAPMNSNLVNDDSDDEQSFSESEDHIPTTSIDILFEKI